MKIALPDAAGRMSDYTLTGTPIAAGKLGRDAARVVYSAAHVVADPFTANDPSGRATVDWVKTMAFRHHLHGLGLGIAEAMDTAQRGMGLDWPGALELIRRTREDLPEALVANGCGTDHLNPADARTLDDVIRAYLEQVEAIQKLDARIILMASRALVRVAKGPADYVQVYDRVLAACDKPVILHWLGEMFDPALGGYWGTTDRAAATETVLGIIAADPGRVDGIKVSLLDRAHEEDLRARLPAGVRLYTGDDYNYPDLIAGDGRHHSDALLGIFAAIAPAAAQALEALAGGDDAGFHALIDPTVPLAHEIFAPPTRYYKAGVAFLAWLNGLQRQFVMPAGLQSARGIVHYARLLHLADAAGLLLDPDLAVARMRALLVLHGVEAA